MKVLVTQLCPALWNPMDCSLPGSSVHGILQLRILEWVAIPFPGESSQPRDRTWVFHIVGRFFTVWATREALANIYVYIDWKREILISSWFCFSGECWEIQCFFFFFNQKQILVIRKGFLSFLFEIEPLKQEVTFSMTFLTIKFVKSLGLRGQSKEAMWIYYARVRVRAEGTDCIWKCSQIPHQPPLLEDALPPVFLNWLLVNV